jgi:hypothetical protein
MCRSAVRGWMVCVDSVISVAVVELLVQLREEAGKRAAHRGSTVVSVEDVCSSTVPPVTDVYAQVFSEQASLLVRAVAAALLDGVDHTEFLSHFSVGDSAGDPELESFAEVVDSRIGMLLSPRSAQLFRFAENRQIPSPIKLLISDYLVLIELGQKGGYALTDSDRAIGQLFDGLVRGGIDYDEPSNLPTLLRLRAQSDRFTS